MLIYCNVSTIGIKLSLISSNLSPKSPINSKESDNDFNESSADNVHNDSNISSRLFDSIATWTIDSEPPSLTIGAPDFDCVTINPVFDAAKLNNPPVKEVNEDILFATGFRISFVSFWYFLISLITFNVFFATSKGLLFFFA